MKRYIIISITEHKNDTPFFITVPIYCCPKHEIYIKDMIENHRDVTIIQHVLQEGLSPKKFIKIQPILLDFQEDIDDYHEVSVEIFNYPNGLNIKYAINLGKQILRYRKQYPSFVFSEN
jgi:hypothetical protein